jgi:TRAP-type C4-dicarboxylate transport system permease small subunit
VNVLASQSVIDPGTVAFLVVFGMAVMLFFIFRSMARHLRKVNEAARAEQEAAESGEVRAQAVGEPGGAP